MQNIDTGSETITFKNPVDLTNFSKAMGYFEKAQKILNGGKTVTFKDFTAWLATTDFVDVTPNAESVMKFNELYVAFRKEDDLVAKFNLFIELFCKEDYAHLIDSDDNAGERMRAAIRQATNE